jgi:hypothetical protein
MKHLHICLVSDQPMPNATSALQLQPDHVELLYTKDKIEQGLRLEEFLKSRGMTVHGTEILPFDMQAVMASCSKLLNKYPDCRISINITGGTKLAALAAFQVFFEAGKELYYVDTYNHKLICLAPEKREETIGIAMPILDYLDIHGFRPESHTSDLGPVMQRQPVTEFLAELAMRKPKLIGILNGSFGVNCDVQELQYPYHLQLQQTKEFNGLATLLAKQGVVRQTSSGIMLPNKEIAQYLRGFWFEEYVYLTAAAIPGVEVKLNVIGRWETRRKEEPKNEFDVMVGADNRVLYLSCKTSNVDRGGAGREYLYELDSLGDNALGLFGKKILASARPIRDSYIHARAASMGIEIIDGEKIRELPQRIKKWLKP